MPLPSSWSTNSSGNIGASWALTVSASSTFARQELDWGPQYSMTVLALRLSGYHNGVSKLHGHVSRDMWQFLWPDTPVGEVPIGHITNGVHTKTWLGPELKDLYRHYLAAELARAGRGSEDVWQPSTASPTQSCGHVTSAAQRQVGRLCARTGSPAILRHGEGAAADRRVPSKLLNPQALTIGFARRFATYKRATLIFRDVERISSLLNDPERPVADHL